SWDAVWDVSVSRDASGWSAEFRIPFSQLRFHAGEDKTFGFAVVREIGRLNETSTWPLLSRKATGYVSSFGDLGGLSIVASPKKLELLPYTLASVTTQPTDGNPLLSAAGAGRRRDRPRCEVRADAGPDAHRERESGLRPGRSRSGGRQSDRVRDVLQRTAAVLRRGIGQLQLRHGLQRRRVQRHVLLAPRR